MKKINLKLMHSISALLISLLSPDLMAQSVAMAPAQSWINKFNSSVNRVANPFAQTTNFNFLNGQVVSDQVVMNGQFTVQNLSPAGDLFNVQASLDQTTVTAKDLNIHLSIDQDLGFGSATIHLDAVCSAVVIRLKSAQNIVVQIDRTFQVQNLQTNFDNLNIDTQLQGCDSINGLQQEVQSRIISILKTQLFEKQLKQLLTEQIGKQLVASINSVTKLFVENKNQEIKVRVSIDAQNKLWVFVGENAETSFPAEDIAQLSQSALPAGLMKKSELEKSLLKNLNAQITQSPIQSVGNASLEKLTCSRWTQFFVWPALKAFPKCFAMQFISEIKEIKITDLAHLNFSIKSNSWAQAKQPLRNIAYFTANTDVSLSPSKVSIKSLVGQHDPEFLKWSGRSSRISSGLVTKTLQAYLKTQVDLALKNNSMLNPDHLQNLKLIGTDSLFFQIK